MARSPRGEERRTETYLAYFRTNDTLERFVKVPATAEDADLLLDYQTTQSAVHGGGHAAGRMAYPSKMTAVRGRRESVVAARPMRSVLHGTYDTRVDPCTRTSDGINAYAFGDWEERGRDVATRLDLSSRRSEATRPRRHR